jgi:hypothetical protein
MSIPKAFVSTLVVSLIAIVIANTLSKRSATAAKILGGF